MQGTKTEVLQADNVAKVLPNHKELAGKYVCNADLGVDFQLTLIHYNLNLNFSSKLLQKHKVS